jgi:CheY-like chemotaxis protein
MDLQMPEEDGFQSTHRIRNIMKLKTPIVALTANALENERLSCLEAGMNDYLSKPYTPDDLYNIILKNIIS